jgi:GDSL-like Lipase/Acylhydrolase family
MAKIVKFLIGLCISGATVFVTLGSFELFLRLVGTGEDGSQHRWPDRPERYFLPSGSASMQGPPASVSKPPGTFRVIAVGGSFTFGPHLQLDDTYPRRLERMLNLNSPAPLQAEVYNYGFSGTSTYGQLPFVGTALANHADLLILQITLNDAEEHPLSPSEKATVFGAPPFTTGLLSHFRLFRFIGARFHNSQTHRRYIDYHHGKFANPATYQLFRNGIHEIAQKCRAAGVPVVFTLFPMFDFPLDEKYPFTETHKIVRDTVAETGSPFLDLFARFAGIPHERLQVIPLKDSHPNEIAHRIAAETILRFLTNRKLIPESLQPIRVYRARKNLRERSGAPRAHPSENQSPG